MLISRLVKYIEQNHTDLVNTKIETSKLGPIIASDIRYRLGERYVHTVNDLIYSNIISLLLKQSIYF